MRKELPGIGIILSNGLNDDKLNCVVSQPLMFDMQWETSKKHQWRVRQKLL